MAQDPNREELANFAKQVDSDLTTSAAEETTNADTSQQTSNAPVEMTLEGELEMYLTMLFNMLFPAFPSLKPLYTPEVIKGIAIQTSVVCRKHGWLVNGLGGQFAEELALLVMVVPLGVATYAAVKHDLAIMKARQKNPDGNGMADPELAQKAAA